MPIHLTQHVTDAMNAHAAQDYPHECCGFLIGKATGDTAIVHKVTAAKNQRDDSPRNRFEIDPGDLVKTDRTARAEGLGVVGFYHSHPDAPARPSEFDREHAWPGYCYIIVSVSAGTPVDLANWRLRDDRTAFESDAITYDEENRNYAG